MDRIHYAGDSILTGGEIAHALFDYAQALSQVGAFDTVKVPTVTANGALAQAELLVGPASQLISRPEESRFQEVVDDEFVADMQQKSRHLRLYGAPPSSSEAHPGGPAEGWSDFDVI